jgi:hypothetical protein
VAATFFPIGHRFIQRPAILGGGRRCRRGLILHQRYSSQPSKPSKPVLRVLRVPLLAATFFPIGHRFIPHGTPDAERSRWRLAAEPFEMHGLVVGFRAAISVFPARI